MEEYGGPPVTLTTRWVFSPHGAEPTSGTHDTVYRDQQLSGTLTLPYAPQGFTCQKEGSTFHNVSVIRLGSTYWYPSYAGINAIHKVPDLHNGWSNDGRQLLSSSY